MVPQGHALAAKASVALKDLDGQRMLLSGGGCETLIQELLAAASSNPDVVCLVRDNATLVSMVREGLGVTIMPELALPQGSSRKRCDQTAAEHAAHPSRRHR